VGWWEYSFISWVSISEWIYLCRMKPFNGLMRIFLHQLALTCMYSILSSYCCVYSFSELCGKPFLYASRADVNTQHWYFVVSDSINLQIKHMPNCHLLIIKRSQAYIIVIVINFNPLPPFYARFYLLFIRDGLKKLNHRLLWHCTFIDNYWFLKMH